MDSLTFRGGLGRVGSPMQPIVLASIVVASSLAPGLRAQEPDVTFPPPQVVVVEAQRVPRDHVQPQLPQPPRAFQHRESTHPRQPVPIGPPNGHAQPDSPEAHAVDPAAMPPAGTGAFMYFQNELCNPGSTLRSPRTPEPANGILRDTVFQTGNWHAAISPDNGQTWTDISPYSFFPASDGGFCCDQQAADVASHGILVWMLQYSQASGGQNRLRFAVANTRDKLRSGNASDWYYYDIRPTHFGFTNTEWFDYEDIAWDGTNFYCRTNVIGASGESIVMRWGLTEMSTAASLSISYYRATTIGGWSHRLAKGCVGVMAFAALRSSTQIDVWTWPAASGSSATRSTRNVASYTTGTVSVVGPDNRDWAGFWNATGQIQGAYGNATECGFSWGCAPQSGRAMPYTRVSRFQLSDRTLIADHDIWSSTSAYLYNDMMSNAAGDIGGTIATGSAASYVHTSHYIIDSYDPWPPATTYSQASGSSGPNVNRFGDYFTVRRHPVSGNTWISNGSSCPDPNTGNHRFVWFGRNDYEPTWVNVLVQSTGVTGVSISQDVEDLSGAKDGLTNYSRRFAPRQGYELTAPATVSVRPLVYAFERWRLQSQPGIGFTNQPLGQLTLTVSDCGNLDDTAVADYVIRRTLEVQSLNPTSGVSITVTPNDINGNGNGSTAFTRYYRDGEFVTLTAPAAIGQDPFRYWVVNGSPRTAGVTSTNVSLTGTVTAIAVYWDLVTGSWQSIGAGCVGSNQQVPAHSIAQSGNQYLQGSPMTWGCTTAPASTAGILHLGLSTTTWLGLPLPLHLNIIGGSGCWLYHDIVASLNVATNANGGSSVVLTLPPESNSIGIAIYSSFAFLDPSVPRALPLTFSNAVRLVPGGLR